MIKPYNILLGIGKEHMYNAPPFIVPFTYIGGASCISKNSLKSRPPFERTSKRRKGFPSETYVKRGERIVHGDKELVEKLGRNYPCFCGSGRRFQELLYAREAL